MVVQTRTVTPKPGTRTYLRCEDCRRTSIILRLRVRHTRRILVEQLNKPVQYNTGEGWRCGYLLKLGPSRASIQPIGAIGRSPDIIGVSIADVKPETGTASFKMPTVEDFYRVNNVKPPLLVVAGRSAAIVAAIAAGKESLIITDGTATQSSVPVVVGEVEPWNRERAVELYQSGMTKIADIASVFGDRNKQNRIRRALKAAGLQ